MKFLCIDEKVLPWQEVLEFWRWIHCEAVPATLNSNVLKIRKVGVVFVNAGDGAGGASGADDGGGDVEVVVVVMMLVDGLLLLPLFILAALVFVAGLKPK